MLASHSSWPLACRVLTAARCFILSPPPGDVIHLPTCPPHLFPLLFPKWAPLENKQVLSYTAN